MDDSMDSVIDETEGIELCKQLSELWQKAGMQNYKWLSYFSESAGKYSSIIQSTEVNFDDDEVSPVKTQESCDLKLMMYLPLSGIVFQPPKKNYLKQIATLF